MPKFYLVIILSFCVYISATAQQKMNKNSKLHYVGNFQIGLANGSAEKNEWALHVVNGMAYKNWFVGLGGGIDQYANKRSLPFYMALQKEFLHTKHRPFLYSNIGYNISWLKQGQKLVSLSSYKELNGWYYDIGVGYKYIFFSNTALGISAGYSLKQQGEQYTANGSFPPPSQNFPEKYEYTFRRMLIKFNYWF